MKQLLIIVVLAAFMSSCRGPAPFRGSVRDLVPREVGDFKLKGELKPISIAPPDQYQSGALRPTEGVIAQYEASGGAQLSFQVVNYPSAPDAGQALKQTEENVRKLGNGAKLTEGTRSGGRQGGASRKVVVEGIAPGFDEVLWVNGSVIYQVSGDNLKAILDFEQSLP
jgi:hypothetical protein